MKQPKGWGVGIWMAILMTPMIPFDYLIPGWITITCLYMVFSA